MNKDTRKKDVVAQLPLTEEMFFNFIREKFPFSVWPTSFDIHDETDARMAASWLITVLQELNAYLLEHGEKQKNLNLSRVPKKTAPPTRTSRKQQVQTMKDLEIREKAK